MGLGFKLLRPDGTSPNGRFKYRLDPPVEGWESIPEEWDVVPGNGCYVAMTHGLFAAGEAQGIKNPIITVVGTAGPMTGVVTPEGVECFRCVRVLRVITDIRELEIPSLRGEAARYMPGIKLTDRLEILRGCPSTYMRRTAWFLSDPDWGKTASREAALKESFDRERA